MKDLTGEWVIDTWDDVGKVQGVTSSDNYLIYYPGLDEIELRVHPDNVVRVLSLELSDEEMIAYARVMNRLTA